MAVLVVFCRLKHLEPVKWRIGDRPVVFQHCLELIAGRDHLLGAAADNARAHDAGGGLSQGAGLDLGSVIADPTVPGP